MIYTNIPQEVASHSIEELSRWYIIDLLSPPFRYLSAMETLESAYPNVLFVYMTGHLDGTGPDGNLYRSNNQIRDYCVAHDKVASGELSLPAGVSYTFAGGHQASFG